ncbi:DUF2779 domain-containing protein [Ulvibacterium marinum]|nr:DUF2779 domain-containing protein [Ulvibacterium marinum]
MMRVLTKSRFKLGLECPNKLFFTNKDSYANAKLEDSFLEALANGGFQVEELARMSFPEGILIEGEDWDYEALWYRTRNLLREEDTTIYEAAFLHEDLFVRTDILVKKGDTIQLIEVKAKSFDSDEEHLFVGARGGLKSGWKAYLFDIAFQKYVVQLCFPDFKVESYIMMADTSKKASIDGLNQLFRITKTVGHRTGIKVLAKSLNDLGTSVLTKVDITHIVADIESDVHKYHKDLSFKEAVEQLKSYYVNDEYANWPTAYSACKNCEFKTTKAERENGLDSGYEHCFTKQHQWKAADFERPAVIDIGGLYYQRGIQLFEKKKFFMSEVTKDDIKFKKEDGKLSGTERNWLQIQKEANADTSIYVDVKGLKAEMDAWTYPLHFIDFETSASALPFHIGRHPYEQVAFQFSHHKVNTDGTIEHASEYLNVKAGVFPNFDFVRALKGALSGDNGSIFRYSNHENTVLNAVYKQLNDSDEPDKKALMDFIQHITKSTQGSAIKWQGKRNMVDLLDVVKDYYYNPLTKGSNSIKDVLPAILETSKKLQEKYSRPIGVLNMSSLNFSDDHVWLTVNRNTVSSPYKNLPPIFEDWSEEAIEKSLSEIESISDGGAALTAYGKLQYTDMDEEEIQEIQKALLKYCELDTLAMVMIYEHFLELVKPAQHEDETR